MTVGDDQTVRVWDLANKMLMGSADLDAGGRCIAYSPDAVRIAVGLGGKPVAPGQKVCILPCKAPGGQPCRQASDFSVVCR